MVNFEDLRQLEKEKNEKSKKKSPVARKNLFVQTRALPERGYLTFEFPQPGRSAVPLVCKFPFFENPIILETGTAKYEEYNPIGRSSSLFSYKYSPSRTVSLTIPVTPIHIIENHPNTIPGKYMEADTSLADNPKKAQAEFFKQAQVVESGSTGYAQIEEHIAKFHEILYPPSETGGDPPENPGFLDTVFERTSGFFSDIANWFSGDNDIAANNNSTKVLETILWWVNLVRASVKNNNSNTMYGPPIVRLTFGPMYNQVPFICRSYELTPISDAGLDLKTLFSRRFEIRMDLSECRVGDFKAYSPTGIDRDFHRDALGGWESLFEHGTTDPHEIGGGAWHRH